jgi:hypothetical protein
VSLLVLSEEDVRDVLDMESCIAAMEEALAALARGELSMPLRFVVRSPGEQLLGLMPAHRGGDEPLFSLKEIVVSPGNSAHGLDPHQGAVLLHDGDRRAARRRQRVGDHGDPHGGRVGGATKCSPPGSRRVAILGAGVQALARRAHDPRRSSCGSGAARPHMQALARAHAVTWETMERRSTGPTWSARAPRRASRSCAARGSRPGRT